MFGQNRGDNRCSELLRFCLQIVGNKGLTGGISRGRGVYMGAELEFEKFERRFTRRAPDLGGNAR